MNKTLGTLAVLAAMFEDYSPTTRSKIKLETKKSIEELEEAEKLSNIAKGLKEYSYSKDCMGYK